LNLLNPLPLPRQNVPRLLDQNAPNINEPVLDTPVPYISTPVLTPSKTTKVQTLKSMAKSIYDAVKKKTNEFADWMLGYVPQSVKKPINERVETLKQQVSDIFKRWYTDRFEIRESATALDGTARQYTIDGREGYDPQSFMREVKSQVVDNRNRQNKVYLAHNCVMEKPDMSTGEVVTAKPTFRSDVETIVDGTDVSEIYSVAVDKTMESMACFQMCGSNWRFRSVVKLNINTTVYRPLRGNSYIPLPKKLADKKAIINPKNEDDQCFKWAVTRALNPFDEHEERIDKNLRQRAEELKWDGIVFPVNLIDINKFEKSNDLSVHVFGYEKEYVYPLRISSKTV